LKGGKVLRSEQQVPFCVGSARKGKHEKISTMQFQGNGQPHPGGFRPRGDKPDFYGGNGV
ncbi:AAEL008727-PA, partial [Aedes aegypti]